MRSLVDLTLFDAHGQIAALVEVKKKVGTTPEWAAEFRRNILAHGGFPRAEFFLIVTPDHIYLWRGAGVEPVVVPPTAVLPAESALAPYLERMRAGIDVMSGSGFAGVVGIWLEDLAWAETRSLPGDPATLRALRDTGLPEAVSGGRVEYDEAA